MSDSRNTTKAVEPVGIEADSTLGETLERGRASTTPFMLLGSVAAVVWSVVALLSLVVFLIVWLV